MNAGGNSSEIICFYSLSRSKKVNKDQFLGLPMVAAHEEQSKRTGRQT